MRGSVHDNEYTPGTTLTLVRTTTLLTLERRRVDDTVDATSSRGRRVCDDVFQGGAGPRADPVGPRRGHGAGIVGGRGEQRDHRRLQGEEGVTINAAVAVPVAAVLLLRVLHFCCLLVRRTF